MLGPLLADEVDDDLRAGAALIVSDTPRRSDAIVVVAGGTPPREARAAELYRAGVAPLVVVSRQSLPGRVQTLIAMGIRPLDFQGEAVAVLLKFGVPREAVVTLDQSVEITGFPSSIDSATARPKPSERCSETKQSHAASRA